MNRESKIYRDPNLRVEVTNLDRLKACCDCKELKSLSLFGSDKRKPDGHTYNCRVCLRKYWALFKRKPETLAQVKKSKSNYYQRNKKKINELGKKRDHLPSEIPKELARWRLQTHVKRGKIKKLPCQTCGNPKSQGHHPDYSKPLDVLWLCSTHHMLQHRKYA